MSLSLAGIGASRGYAVGRVFRPRREDPCAQARACGDPQAELEAFTAALATTRAELKALRDKARRELGDLKAEIFEAHLSILGDPDLAEAVAEAIQAGQGAADAVTGAMEGFAQLLSAEGGLIGARADDLRDLGARIRAALTGALSDPWEGLSEPSVVLSRDLMPSETLRMDKTKVLAILTSAGSNNSHSSIIARSMEIPAVVGLGYAAEGLEAGTLVAVDGSRGLVVVEPEAAEVAAHEARRTAWLADLELCRRFVGLPTRTADGLALDVEANIGGPGEVEAALAGGAEGVGLFRTEFMFMDRPVAPTEDEQYQAYRHVLEAMGGRPVIIRTLDAGGDKPVAGLPAKPEENPFLGLRAVRFCLAHEAIFRTQLRALLRASPHGTLRIMIPMVALPEELRRAKVLLHDEAARLRAEGLALDRLPELGIMIEIPAAALAAERLAAEADFFSIGTNDLVQYLMAADRGNPDVAYLSRPLESVVLGLIAQVVAAAKRQGIRVGVCGEMAADPLAMPLLVGLGVRELSMSPSQIARTRASLAGLDSGRLARLAETVLRAEDHNEVKQRVISELESQGVVHGL